MKDIEILEYSGEDFKQVVSFQEWSVALLNYAERFSKVSQIERHILTDEVFVLLQGEATLFIGEELTQYSMETNKIYNIKKGTWHAITTSKNAKVLIVENSNTSVENSEYRAI